MFTLNQIHDTHANIYYDTYDTAILVEIIPSA